MSRVYASLRHPLYYAITVLLGACLALVCCGDVAFQALYAAAHFAASVAVTRAARADLGEQRDIWLVWATAVVGANAAVYGLWKPLWVRGQRGAGDDLKRRVARLARRRPGAPRREPDGDAKRPGDVVLADPPAPLPGVDLGF